MTVVQLCVLVRLLTVRPVPLSGAYLAFGNLFPMLDYLTLSRLMGRNSVLPRLDVTCFAQTQESLSLLLKTLHIFDTGIRRSKMDLT